MPLGPRTLLDALKGAVAEPHKTALNVAQSFVSAPSPGPFSVPRPAAPKPSPSVANNDPVAAILSAPVKPVSAAKKKAVAREANSSSRFPATQRRGWQIPSAQEIGTTLNESFNDLLTVGDVASKMGGGFAYDLADWARREAARPAPTLTTKTGATENLLGQNIAHAGAVGLDAAFRGADYIKKNIWDPTVKASEEDAYPRTFSMAQAVSLSESPMDRAYTMANGLDEAQSTWLRKNGLEPSIREVMSADQIDRVVRARRQKAAEKQQRLIDQGVAPDPNYQAAAASEDYKVPSETDSAVTRWNRILGFEDLPSVSDEVKRAKYGEGAAVLAEIANPIGLADEADPVMALLSGGKRALRIGKEIKAGTAAVTGSGINLPTIPRSLAEVGQQIKQVPKTAYSMAFPSPPADPVAEALKRPEYGPPVIEHIDPIGPKEAALVTPLPSRPVPTDVVADHEWVAAAREVVQGGGGVEDISKHLDIPPEQAQGLFERVAPQQSPPGYRGIMQAPRGPQQPNDEVARLLGPSGPQSPAGPLVEPTPPPASAAAPEGPRITPEEVPAPAPPQSAPPPERAPQPTAGPSAPDYEPVNLPGVREPAASSAPAMGGGDAPQAGPVELPPPSPFIQSLASRWGSMSSNARAKMAETLSAAEKLELNQIITKEAESLTSRYADPTARRRNHAGVGVFGGPQDWAEAARLVRSGIEGVAAAENRIAGVVAKPFLAAERAMNEAASAVASTGASAASRVTPPAIARAATQMKHGVERWTSQMMMSSSVQGREELAKQLEDFADAQYGRSLAVKEEVGDPLRELKNQRLAQLALQNPDVRAAIRKNPRLANTSAAVDKARTSIDDATQEYLATKYAVPLTSWKSLMQQEQQLLAQAIEGGAQTGDALVDTMASAARAKLIASGAIVKDAAGNWAFKDPYLRASEALPGVGSYLPRRYASFEAKKFDLDKTLKEATYLTPDEREWLARKFAPQARSAFASRDTGAIRSFLERENVSPNLRKALGELTGEFDPKNADSGYLAAMAIHDLQRATALTQLREAVALDRRHTVPMDASVIDWENEFGVKPMQVPDDTSRFGQLAGRFVHPEVLDSLTFHFGKQDDYAKQTAEKIMGAWKWLRTVGQVPSHFRQAMQNLLTGGVNGDGVTLQLLDTVDAIKSMASRDADYRHARDLGLWRGTYHDQETSSRLHAAVMDAPGEGHFFERLGRFGDAIHGVAKTMSKAWEYSDDAARYAMFRRAKIRGMSDSEALRWVKENSYDGTRLSRLERMVTGRGVARTSASRSSALNAADVISTFISAPFFAASKFSARQSKALLGIGQNNWMPMTAPERALRAWGVVGAGAALWHYFGQQDGRDVGEDRPSFAKGVLDNWLPGDAPLPPITSSYLGGDGKPQFVSLSPYMPWGESTRFVFDTMEDAPGTMVKTLPMGLNPVAQSVVDVAANNDSFTNRPITNTQKPRAEQFADNIGHLSRVMGPDLMPGIPGALAAAMGDESQRNPTEFGKNVVRYGGPSFQKLGAGLWNDFIAQSPEQRMQDPRWKDQSTLRALFSMAGVRTYAADKDLNEALRANEKKGRINRAKDDLRKLMAQPQRSDAQKQRDAERTVGNIERIAGGEPYRLPGPQSLLELLSR